MSAVEANVCANCGAVLVLEGLEDAIAVCARCRRPLTRKTSVRRPPLSRKALLSLVLALLSPVGSLLTGGAAILLGWWALRDMRRKPGTLRGRGLAVAGVALGPLLGLVCGLGHAGIAALAWQISVASQGQKYTIDPAEISLLAHQVGIEQPPPGMLPHSAQEEPMPFLGTIRTVRYVDRKESPLVVVLAMHLPAMFASQPQNVRMMARSEVSSGWSIVTKVDMPPPVEPAVAPVDPAVKVPSGPPAAPPGPPAPQQTFTYTSRHIDFQKARRWTCVVASQTVEVVESTGTDPETQQPAREYLAILTHHQAPLAVVVAAREAPPDAPVATDPPPVVVTEDYVRAFLESLRLDPSPVR